MSEKVAEAIDNAFTSQYGTIIDAIVDSFQAGGENGDKNLVGVIEELAYGAKQIAAAITPQDVSPGHDATGGTVGCLTEAIMGVTGDLKQTASAIHSLAEAVDAKSV